MFPRVVIRYCHTDIVGIGGILVIVLETVHNESPFLLCEELRGLREVMEGEESNNRDDDSEKSFLESSQRSPL